MGKEAKPEEWEDGVMIPLHKKDDRMECKNYGGICLLNVAYKILAKIIQMRLLKYTEDITGEYQSGFRSGSSTTDHLFSVRQLLEKCYEFNVEHTHLFIDFQQAYDSVRCLSMWQIMCEFVIPAKLIKLTNLYGIQ